MHEFSLIDDLMKKIETVTASQEAKRAVVVTVKLGALSHISADHFREHFDHAAKGTVAEGARLEVHESKDINDALAQEILLESVEVEV